MVAIKLDGEQVSLNLKSALKQRISKLQETSITPGLGQYSWATMAHQRTILR